MNEQVKKNAGLAIRIIVPVILIFVLFRNLDWQIVWQTLQGYPIWMLVGSTGLYIVANLLFGLRWHYFLKSVKVDVPYTYLASLVFYSLFLSNFLPTTIGGDLVKVAGLLSRDGGDQKTLKVSSVVADRIFSFASKVLLLPITLWVFKGFLPLDFQLPWLQSLVLIDRLPKGLREKIKHYLRTIRPWFKPRQIVIRPGHFVDFIAGEHSRVLAGHPRSEPKRLCCSNILYYPADLLCQHPADHYQRDRRAGRFDCLSADSDRFHL